MGQDKKIKVVSSSFGWLIFSSLQVLTMLAFLLSSATYGQEWVIDDSQEWIIDDSQEWLINQNEWEVNNNQQPKSPTRQHDGKLPAFGGPDAPSIRLEEDRKREPSYRFPEIDEAFEAWYQWKNQLNENSNIKFGGYYILSYQLVNDSLTDDDDALGGKLRFTSTWTPIGKDTGNFGRLAFTLDYRHKFTNIASTELAEQFAYLGQTQVVLSNAGLAIVHLNWAQAFRGGDAGFIIGRIDPNDYFDVLAYASPWTGFANSTIQLNASLSFQQSSWGILGELV